MYKDVQNQARTATAEEAIGGKGGKGSVAEGTGKWLTRTTFAAVRNRQTGKLGIVLQAGRRLGNVGFRLRAPVPEIGRGGTDGFAAADGFRDGIRAEPMVFRGEPRRRCLTARSYIRT